MPFNSVDAAPEIAYAGQVAFPMQPRIVESKVVETAIAPGAIAKFGTTTDQIKPLAPGDTANLLGKIAGVVLLSPSRPFEEIASSAYQPLATASVMSHGFVVMPFAAAVTEGQVVAQDLTTGLLYGYAEGTAAASITTGRVVIPGLRVARTTTAAGPAIVRVNTGFQNTTTVGTG